MSVFVLLTILLVSCEKNPSVQDDTSSDAVPKISAEDLLDRMYICYMADLVIDNKDTIYKIVNEQAILETQVIESKVTGTRGIISGAINIAKFSQKIIQTQRARTAALINLVYGKDRQLTIDQLYDCLKTKCANHDINSAAELRSAMLSGKCDSYILQWYNDVYYFSGADIPSPSSLAYMTASSLIEDAAGIVLAGDPSDILGWGSITNDIVNSIGDAINKDGSSLTTLSKAAVQACTRLIQIDKAYCDQDIIDEFSNFFQAAIDEYLETMREGGPAQQALDNFIKTNLEYLVLPNYLKGVSTWYCYPGKDYRYEFDFEEKGNVTCSKFNSKDDLVDIDAVGKWKLSGENLSISFIVDNKTVRYNGKGELLESGSQVRIVINNGSEKVILRNTPDPGWNSIPNLDMFAGTFYANPYDKDPEYRNTVVTIDAAAKKVVFDYGNHKDELNIVEYKAYVDFKENPESVTESQKNQKYIGLTVEWLTPEKKAEESGTFNFGIYMTEDAIFRIATQVKGQLKKLFFKEEDLDLFRPSRICGTWYGTSSETYDMEWVIAPTAIGKTRINRKNPEERTIVWEYEPGYYSNVYTSLYFETEYYGERFVCDQTSWPQPFIKYVFPYANGTSGNSYLYMSLDGNYIRGDFYDSNESLFGKYYRQK